MTRGSTIAGSTEVHVEDTSTRETGSFVLLLLSGVAAYLYVSLFFLPSTPFLLGGDQVFFWLPGMRMLDHARIYQDFFQFTPPGTDFVYFVLFRLLGTHLWDTNVFVLLLGVTLCWMCFSIAREMMSRAAALMAMALFLVLIYCKLLNGTHHWLSVLCVMAAVKLWIRRSMAVATLAVGALLGLASFFTQTRGGGGVGRIHSLFGVSAVSNERSVERGAGQYWLAGFGIRRGVAHSACIFHRDARLEADLVLRGDLCQIDCGSREPSDTGAAGRACQS
jgi:hypothetical protein